jgi:hypothetical protein
VTVLSGSEITDVSVPAELGYVRVLRLATAGVCSMFDFDHEFVDDVKAAVGEAAAIVLGTSGAPGRLRLVLRCDEECVSGTVRGWFDVEPDRTRREDDLSEALLRPLVDQFAIDHGRRSVSFEMRS